MLASTDIIGDDNIAQPFVVTPVLVIFDEIACDFLQLIQHVMKYLVDFPFQGAMVPLNLAVALRMEGPGSDVSYPRQSQVPIELLGNIACTIV